MKNIAWFPAGLLAGLLLIFGPSGKAEACAETAYYGTICFMAGTFCPVDHVPANGQLIPFKGHQALYSLIFSTYGGDGKTTVGLPDLRGRSPVGSGVLTTGGKPLAVGQQRGAEQVALSEKHLPSHDHLISEEEINISGTLKANDTGASSNNPERHYPAGLPTSDSPNFAKSGVLKPMFSDLIKGKIKLEEGARTTSTGGNLPFPIVGPRLGLTACIRVQKADYPGRH